MTKKYTSGTFITIDWDHPTNSLLSESRIVNTINAFVDGRIIDRYKLCKEIGAMTNSLVDDKLPKEKVKKLFKVLNSKGIKQNGNHIKVDNYVTKNKRYSLHYLIRFYTIR